MGEVGKIAHMSEEQRRGSLSQVHVKGFRSLRDTTLELSSEVTVLAGANGSGKSNVLRALELIGQLPAGNIQETLLRWGGFSQQLHVAPKEMDNANHIEIELWEKPRQVIRGVVQNGYAVRLDEAANDESLLKEKFYYWDKASHSEPFNPDWGRGRKESRLTSPDLPFDDVTHENRVRMYVRPLIEGLQAFHFDDTSLNAPPLTSTLVSDNVELADDASNIAAILLHLRETERDAYDSIVWAVRGVAPFFDDFVLRPVGDNVQLRWKQKGARQVLPGNALSSGTLRYLCLSVLLNQPQLPQTIVLDEPELGLHPLAISHFVELLRSSARGRRIVVATQSVTMLNQFSIDEVVIASRQAGATELHRPDASEYEDWLEDYTLGQLWETNVLDGGYPRFESGAP